MIVLSTSFIAAEVLPLFHLIVGAGNTDFHAFILCCTKPPRRARGPCALQAGIPRPLISFAAFLHLLLDHCCAVAPGFCWPGCDVGVLRLCRLAYPASSPSSRCRSRGQLNHPPTHPIYKKIMAAVDPPRYRGFNAESCIYVLPCMRSKKQAGAGAEHVTICNGRGRRSGVLFVQAVVAR